MKTKQIALVENLQKNSENDLINLKEDFRITIDGRGVYASLFVFVAHQPIQDYHCAHEAVYKLKMKYIVCDEAGNHLCTLTSLDKLAKKVFQFNHFNEHQY